jgi:hypothetical protein
MKYSSQGKQYRLDLFPTTLEKSLDPSNRWYKLAGAIPWEEIERVYNKCLRNKHRGGGNKPVRMIVGALIIKHKMNLSDEETVQIIPENSYMQYFVGIEEFTSKPIFDSSLFVYIRKRLDLETFNDLTLAVMEEEKRREEEAGKKRVEGNRGREDGVRGNHPANNTEKEDGKEDDSFMDEDGKYHSGCLKVDATCCDVEVKYPTDLDVLNDAREVSEHLIDKLCKLSASPKPRTCRKQARREFLRVIKKKRKPKTLIRKGIRQQPGYPGRNIQSVAGMVSGSSTSILNGLNRTGRQWIGTIIKVYHQQKGMYDTKTHQCGERIISVFQPHVRPIVRGKSKSKVEFGAKIGVAVANGYTFIDHFSRDAYNESVDLKTHVEAYIVRFGHLPATCYADKIYMNRENRAYLKGLHVRAAGKPLGRPGKEMQTEEYKLQSAKDMGKRNESESTFGTGKRVYNANDVRAKLPDTADAWTAACFLAKNVMKFLKGLLWLLFERSKLGLGKKFLMMDRIFLIQRATAA